MKKRDPLVDRMKMDLLKRVVDEAECEPYRKKKHARIRALHKRIEADAEYWSILAEERRWGR